MSTAPFSPVFASPGSAAPSRLAVTALWTFVTVAVIAVTAAGQTLKGGDVDVRDRVVWEAGWLGWIPLTYLVLAICRRHPIDRRRRTASVLRLAVYGIGIVGLQVAIDFACNAILGAVLKGTPFTWKHLLYILVFHAHLFYGVYWMIVGAAHAYEFHARYLRGQLVSTQLESKLAKAELSLLKGQLQPHFLFNTHNVIVSLIMKQENDAAIRMLTRLSDLLRVALSRSRQQLVELGEELGTLRLYLDIQHERFRDRLDIRIDVPAELHGAEVPHLILQPLVENAFSHGLDDVTEGGRLDISARREGATLVLRVRDNGAGFDAGNAGTSPASTTGGVGLTNTRERLLQLHGGGQSLEIESAPGRGCVVTIRIPYRPANRAEADSP